MLKAVIFDMDGLLVDSEPLWVRAELEVFGAVGVKLTEHDCARTKGLRVDDVVSYWHAQTNGGFLDATPDEVEARLIHRVAELMKSDGRALPGVTSALAAARAKVKRIGLASSSPFLVIHAALERLGLEQAFDTVESAKSEPFGKPHPGIFLSAAHKLGARPLECVVIEDSLNGVIAAKAARMGCVAVPFDHPKHDPRFVIADLVIGSLEDLTSDVLARL